MKPRVLGHRGSIHFPENTLKALSHALDANADGVEIDIQRTLDGKFILSHDENLKRLTGQDINVRRKTYAELKAIRIQGEPLAILEEALDLVKSRSKLIDIEVKNPNDFKPLGDYLAKEMYRGIIVSSFWHDGIDAFKENLKSFSVAYIYSHQPADLSLYARKVDYLKPFYEFVRKETYASYAQKTIPWTVNDAKTLDALTSIGIFGVITDVPETLTKHPRTQPSQIDHPEQEIPLPTAQTQKQKTSATVDPMYLRYLSGMIERESLSVGDKGLAFTALNNLLPLHVESIGLSGGAISLSEKPPFTWSIGQKVAFEMTFYQDDPLLELNIRETGQISVPVRALVDAFQFKDKE